MSKSKNYLDTIEEKLNYYFKHTVPMQLPEHIKNTIANKILPWAVVILLLSQLMKLSSMFSLFSYFHYISIFSPLYNLSRILYALSTLLMGLSLLYLFNLKRLGWKLLFYSQLALVVQAVVYWLQNLLEILSLASAIFWTLIILFFIFQVRDYYTNK